MIGAGVDAQTCQGFFYTLYFMAKELPYFKFEPAEYLTKDVSFCSLSAQGLFINLCSYYWQRGCELNKIQFLRRFNNLEEFEELVKEQIIYLDESENIAIAFLDAQYFEATNKSRINSENGRKGGRPKKQKETEIKPNQNPIKTESKGIREDKIIEDKIIEEYRGFAHLSISVEEYKKLVNEYTHEQVIDILDSIENFKGNKKYKSLYLTAKTWLKRDAKKVEEAKPIKPAYHRPFPKPTN